MKKKGGRNPPFDTAMGLKTVDCHHPPDRVPL